MKNSYPPGFTWLTVRDKKRLKILALVTIIWLFAIALMFAVGYRAEAQELPIPLWPIILCVIMTFVFLADVLYVILTIEPYVPTGPKR